MRNKVLLCLVYLFLAMNSLAAGQWQKLWTLEAESPNSVVTSLGGDTIDIRAPKGLTLWYNRMLKGNVTIEYDAQVVVAGKTDRLSDLNSFFMASDPNAPTVFTNMKSRNGIFANQNSLQMYYLGYGGNYNTTTRFRRYTGEGRPPVITEYTDSDHLLGGNHWYHIRISKQGSTILYYIDGKCIVDYNDEKPLERGWFGVRTTLSHIQIANFSVYPTPKVFVPLHWVGGNSSGNWPVTFGIPFAKGEMTDRGLGQLSVDGLPCDSWVNARWQDGSVKWAGLATVIPKDNKEYLSITADRNRKPLKSQGISIRRISDQLLVDNGRLRIYFPCHGTNLLDSVLLDGRKISGGAQWIASTTGNEFTNRLDTIFVERQGRERACIRIDGRCHAAGSSMTLPYTLRFYIYRDCPQIRLVHTFVYDGDQNKDFINRLGLRFAVPLREENYNRQVALSGDGKMWMEPVQPLVGRRELSRNHDYEADQLKGIKVPDRTEMDSIQNFLIDNWASWDSYRLLQLDDGSYTIRKRASTDRPWIGTFTGHHSDGLAYVGDTDGGLAVSMKDFWQSYPASLQIDNARSSEASLTVWLWSPEAEKMDLRHYDDHAHNLEASYEDVQEGLSTPYGIARTHTLTLMAFDAYPGTDNLYELSRTLANDPQLLPTPEYLHDKKAFGVWSLERHSPDNLVKDVEARLNKWIDIYKNEQKKSHWYGFWNYGDFMHAYDEDRHEWRYDIGGFAWDNTELGTPEWLWYEFLRTGRSDIWTMALAMTRHNSEVDTYHIGPLKGLGSRHNVSHWGCGAKEARISQAAFSRFAYYLTSDDRLGDIMHDEVDADTILYHLDPMRLAEPRSKFPTSAPARLRIGPDWLAYAGNWMTEWERTGNLYYKNKFITGMKSIAALPYGILTGHLAKGYDPKTGVITSDGDPNLRWTNHLMTIMGGFELMNELMEMTDVKEFKKCWLDFADKYKKRADELKRKFPVRRLEAYASFMTGDRPRAQRTWQSLMRDRLGLSTNEAALWSLDAIYMLEVLPTDNINYKSKED